MHKTDLIQKLSYIQQGVTDTIHKMTPEQFNTGKGELWSPAGYLKHLILSVKPVAKAIQLPPDRLQKLFGMSERPSQTYDEIVNRYTKRLAEGVRAEDYDKVTPDFYRIPDDVTDEQQYLADTWHESNQRLIDAVQNWEDADLDTHQMPHPAIGLVTVREMIYFTIHHNTLHWRDIQGN